MNDSACEYTSLVIKAFPTQGVRRSSSEGRLWKDFKTPYTAKHIGSVSSVDFCAESSNHLAATSSTRVTVYDGSTHSVRRVISRFADKAYCARFRSDGELLAAGGESGIVQVFHSNSRALLRQFHGHRRPVHTVGFAADKLHLLSGGDDAAVRLWDVATGAQTCCMAEHDDYVRTSACNPNSNDVWATGGYDHTCKLWDVRGHRSVASVHHGAPVESAAFFPSGAILVTAGATYLRLWDLYRGGTLLYQLASHQKTITAVAVCSLEDSRAASELHLVTASLDGHVKVHAADSFQLTHSSKYPAPILSMALSVDCTKLAVGMTDGVLSIRQRRRRTAGGLPSQVHGYPSRLTAANRRYFIRGQSTEAAAGGYVVNARRRAAIPDYDRLLRQFRYREALDAALAVHRPQVVAAVVDELVIRGGLAAALSGRDTAGILLVLRHIRPLMEDLRYAPAASAICQCVLDIFGSLSCEDAGHLATQFAALRERVQIELRVHEQLSILKGMLEPILAVAASGL